MAGCELCPRRCGIDRAAGEIGICGQGAEMRIARAALHPFEEPSVSGTRGSGTVFFVGCSLGCVFCQNRKISRSQETGEIVSPADLAEVFLRLEGEGAHNINLVTPTHFADGVIEALACVKSRLTIPVLYNTSGYERVETLRRLEGLVDIYMPDFKYADPALAEKLSSAPDYPQAVEAALLEMYRQVGAYELDGEGILRRGLLVRHLVLPGFRKDSLAVLDRLAALFPKRDILVSLMSQYTPDFAADASVSSLHRRLTRFEYESVVERVRELGFEGYLQEKSSASASYTPDF